MVENAITLSLNTKISGSIWTPTKYGPLKSPRSEHACIQAYGMVYVIGGRNANSDSLKSVEILNLKTRKFSDGPPVPFPLDGCQAVKYENVLYIFDRSGIVLHLDENKNKWKVSARLGPTTWDFLPAPIIKSNDCLQGLINKI